MFTFNAFRFINISFFHNFCWNKDKTSFKNIILICWFNSFWWGFKIIIYCFYNFLIICVSNIIWFKPGNRMFVLLCSTTNSSSHISILKFFCNIFFHFIKNHILQNNTTKKNYKYYIIKNINNFNINLNIYLFLIYYPIKKNIR